jgi:hypothetical protein
VKATTIHDLPEDVLAAIFKKLQPPALAATVWPGPFPLTCSTALLPSCQAAARISTFYREPLLLHVFTRSDLEAAFHSAIVSSLAAQPGAAGQRGALGLGGARHGAHSSCGDRTAAAAIVREMHGHQKGGSELLVAMHVCRCWDRVIRRNVVHTCIGQPAFPGQFPGLRELWLQAAGTVDVALLAGVHSPWPAIAIFAVYLAFVVDAGAMCITMTRACIRVNAAACTAEERGRRQLCFRSVRWAR